MTGRAIRGEQLGRAFASIETFLGSGPANQTHDPDSRRQANDAT